MKNMMKKSKRIFFLYLSVSIISFSCATTKPQLEPIVSKRIWENKAKSEVFAKCLEVVQKSGYGVLSESENKGTIQTDWRIFKKENKMRRYNLDIQILESAEKTITVTVKTKYQEGETVKSPTPDGLWQALPMGGVAWRDIPRDSDLEEYLDDLHRRFQDLLGPAKAEIETC